MKTVPAVSKYLFAAALALVVVSGCATQSPAHETPADKQAAAIRSLLPADALLLGEQHDAAEHHELERAVVARLANDGKLAVLALEMSEHGNSTAGLPVTADESAVKARLRWDDKAWPWAAYGPAIMAAVRKDVPVVGANLPRERMRDAMAETALDVQLSGPALKAQQQAVREGHCNLLPESQITPMTRIQIARDRMMARTIALTVQPDRTVVLITGAAHADKALGVPQHLPVELKVKSVKMQAGATAVGGRDPAVYDTVWQTAALPARDYCKDVKR
ncbi:ChaN family lipoprotein [Variovorax sp. VNK109]|uniref:ChaN family lipoprotein n=1 Tax=Variovorax sp. VNK109 TaxID=3400919 RepID=UPI003C0065F6